MTPAIKSLQKKNCAFRTLQYEHDSSHENYGLEAVEKLNLPKEQVFKTLVAQLDNGTLVVGIVPVDKFLDLKSLAKAAKAKKSAMADKEHVMRTTGYVLGGVSPFGQKKRLNTFVDESALNHAEIYVSAGKRGLEVAISPSDLMSILSATAVSIAKSR